MTTSLENALRDLTTNTIRIQPVDPPKRTSEENGQLAAAVIFGVPAVLAAFSWFLMLAFGTLHDLWPTIPVVGYWQAVTLVLGLNVVTAALKPRAFRWSRR